MTNDHGARTLIAKTLLAGGLAVAGLGMASGTALAFNPQPDPPGKPIAHQNGPDTVERGPITVNVDTRASTRVGAR